MNHLSASYNIEKYDCTINHDGTLTRWSDYNDQILNKFKSLAATVRLFYNLDLVQVNLLASETIGKHWHSGTPSQNYGPHLWIQFVEKNGTKVPYVYYRAQETTKNTIENALFWALVKIVENPDIRSNIFYVPTISKDTPTKDAQIGQIMEVDAGNKILQYKLVGIREKSL